MPSVLITRPRHETTTHYLYHWTGPLVDEANRRKLKVIDLQKDKANKKTLESYLKKQKPDVVLLNGHGNEHCVTGHENKVLIEAGENTSLLKGMIVYMRACSAGKLLGIDVIKMGARAFIGYVEPFRFYTRDEMFNKPLEDDYAKPFFESSNQIGYSLLKGKSGTDAHKDSLVVYRKNIARLLTSNATNSFVVPDLMWNMHHQVCLEK